MQGQLQARDRHAAADAGDQHRLAGAQRALAEQHAPGREVGGQQRTGFHQIDVIGQGQHAARGHGDVFGKAAVAVLAHDVRMQAQRLVAREAIAALAAEGIGVHHGLLAGLYADLKPAARIGLHHHAGRFHAQRLRQAVRDACAVVPHVEVHAVQRRRVHAQQHLAGAAHGHRHIAHAEAVAASLLKNGGFHDA